MLAILAFASSMMANEANRKESESSTIKFSDCPKAVQKTLTREARGAKIKTVDLECHDEMVVFEADVIIEGRNYEILVSPKGKLLAKVLDEDPESTVVEMKLADCPKPVRKALARETDGPRLPKSTRCRLLGATFMKSMSRLTTSTMRLSLQRMEC